MGQAIAATLDDIRSTVDRRLQDLAKEWDPQSSQTGQAMGYSLLAPGKRVRAAVTILVADCFGADRESPLIPACAIEMAHAASLILDDMPCMDDADLRRGRPANHVAFGEEIALLAAFGLLNQAYGLIGTAEALGPSTRMRLSALLSRSIGLDGLIGGQEEDLRGAKDRDATVSIGSVHSRKTGALFVAAAEAGAIVADASERETTCIVEFAGRLGRAFQALDDIIDAYGCANAAGKNTRQDARSDGDRPNLVTMVGRDRALKSLMLQVQRAVDAIGPLGAGAEPLGQLAHSLAEGAFELADRSVAVPLAARS